MMNIRKKVQEAKSEYEQLQQKFDNVSEDFQYGDDSDTELVKELFHFDKLRAM